MALLIAALAVAILLSAFLSAAEVAVFMLSESRVRALAEEGTPGAVALGQLRQRPDRTMVLLRLLDALADVSAGALAAIIVLQHLDQVAVVAAVGAVTLLVLYLGELVPLGIVAHQGVRFALRVAPGILFMSRVLAPMLSVLARLARIDGERRERASSTITETEIRQLTALGRTQGGIEEHERELIERAFRLDDTKTWDIMTPRVDIYAWSDSLPLAAIAADLGTARYSRVPVYGETIDNITGVLYVRDAYQALVRGQRDVPLRALAREPLLVPGSLTLAKLLREFQNRRIHMAVVVDEYGGTDGIVTLEDVIEELVGEIVDETDVAEDLIVRVSRTEVLALGDADLREVNHIFNTAFPQLEHRSLNGYLLEEFGRVPESGEALEREGVNIEVLDASDTQVLRARLKRVLPLPEKPPLPAERAVDAEGEA